MEPTNSNSKIKELTLYVAQRCETHQLFGTIKLNKILFFSDVNAYLRRGESITGSKYEKREFGPVPERMREHIDELVAKRDAVVVERDMPNMTQQRRVVAVTKPDLSSFSAEDISIVNEVIEWMQPMTAHEISELSHRSVGWDVARMGETIPLATAIIPEMPLSLTPNELMAGARLAEQLAGQAIGA